MKDDSKAPFRVLGEKLKLIRQHLHESASEVSGAVEIDEQSLHEIEQGKKRPSQAILELLINHFGIQDDDANHLWHLAGYDRDQQDDDPTAQQTRTMIMIMAVDPRVVYSDSAQITANSQGVIINFAQGTGTSQALTTARIGMSREQAATLVATLQQALTASTPRQLSAGTGSTSDAVDSSSKSTEA